MRQKYWFGVFANRVECPLSLIDLQTWAHDLPDDNRTLAKHAYVTVDRIPIRGNARRAESKIRRMLAEADEQWNLGDDWNPLNADYVAFVWDTADRTSLPAGFTTFSVTIFDGEEPRIKSTRDEIRDVMFTHEFVFVRPEKRGAGLGRYLSFGIIEWIGRCRLGPPRSATSGVEVRYCADILNVGGAQCAAIVIDYLQCLHDWRRDLDYRSQPLPWLINSFSDISDFEYWVASDSIFRTDDAPSSPAGLAL